MKNHKFTWIDGLVIAVVVILLAGSFLKFFVKDSTALNQETIAFEYQLRIAGIRQVSVDSLQVGDSLFDNGSKEYVGVISDIQVKPAETTFHVPDGTIEKATYENRFDVTLTISAEGVPSAEGYRVGTTDLSVNRNATYFTKYSIWNATLLSMS